jgi:hypothetical protein
MAQNGSIISILKNEKFIGDKLTGNRREYHSVHAAIVMYVQYYDIIL